jgi:hypothetical protein
MTDEDIHGNIGKVVFGELRQSTGRGARHIIHTKRHIKIVEKRMKMKSRRRRALRLGGNTREGFAGTTLARSAK